MRVCVHVSVTHILMVLIHTPYVSIYCSLTAIALNTTWGKAKLKRCSFYSVNSFLPTILYFSIHHTFQHYLLLYSQVHILRTVMKSKRLVISLLILYWNEPWYSCYLTLEQNIIPERLHLLIITAWHPEGSAWSQIQRARWYRSDHQNLKRTHSVALLIQGSDQRGLHELDGSNHCCFFHPNLPSFSTVLSFPPQAPCRKLLNAVLRGLELTIFQSDRDIYIPNCDTRGFYRKKQVCNQSCVKSWQSE